MLRSFAFALGAILLMFFIFWLMGRDPPANSIIGTRCAVGVAGTAASITIEGWGARETCDSWIASRGGDPPGMPFTLFRLTYSPSQPVVCEVQLVKGKQRAIVR